MAKGLGKQAVKKISPSKTGPKTLKGKSAVSKNAITHGVTSTRLTTAQQTTDYNQFIAELTSHYTPTSPLEKLQIERIAMLRAKLKHLYRVETVQLEISARSAKNNLDQVFKLMPHIQGITKGMLREMMTFGETLLPCNLTIEVLVNIISEMEETAVRIDSDEDLKEYMPQLASYLEQVKVDKGHRSLLHRLIAVGELVKRAISEGENYGGFMKLQLEAIKPQQAPLDEHEQEIEDHIQRQQAKRAAEREASLGAKVHTIISSPAPSYKEISVALEQLKVLARAYLRAFQSVEEAHEIQSLAQDSLTLDPEDADRFLRYQTTLERRLSTAMGELLQMRRMA